jgi:hypothetical protein
MRSKKNSIVQKRKKATNVRKKNSVVQKRKKATNVVARRTWVFGMRMTPPNAMTGPYKKYEKKVYQPAIFLKYRF